MYELKSSSGLPLPVVKSVKLSFTNTPCKTERVIALRIHFKNYKSKY